MSELVVPSHWNPHWNYRLGGEPRSICACPDGPYEGARLVTTPRFCERCGGLVNAPECGAQYGSNPDRCYHEEGHPGPHSNRWGTTWT